MTAKRQKIKSTIFCLFKKEIIYSTLSETLEEAQKKAWDYLYFEKAYSWAGAYGPHHEEFIRMRRTKGWIIVALCSCNIKRVNEILKGGKIDEHIGYTEE